MIPFIAVISFILLLHLSETKNIHLFLPFFWEEGGMRPLVERVFGNWCVYMTIC